MVVEMFSFSTGTGVGYFFYLTLENISGVISPPSIFKCHLKSICSVAINISLNVQFAVNLVLNVGYYIYMHHKKKNIN